MPAPAVHTPAVRRKPARGSFVRFLGAESPACPSPSQGAETGGARVLTARRAPGAYSRPFSRYHDSGDIIEGPGNTQDKPLARSSVQGTKRGRNAFTQDARKGPLLFGPQAPGKRPRLHAESKQTRQLKLTRFFTPSKTSLLDDQETGLPREPVVGSPQGPEGSDGSVPARDQKAHIN